MRGTNTMTLSHGRCKGSSGFGKDLGEDGSDLHSYSGTEKDEEDIAKEPKPKNNKAGREDEGPNRLKNKLSSMKGRTSKNKDQEGQKQGDKKGLRNTADVPEQRSTVLTTQSSRSASINEHP
ncbi:hypothetical protein TURU_160816 [Turdus rufiventris]|nr:hypothetical protein TURU_160816 [Turdus rufiventris]